MVQTSNSVDYLRMVEQYLDNVIAFDNTLPHCELIRAMRYSLLGGGKRIRAQIVLAFCEGLGGQARAALPAAAAVEMIHAYSLIHDDLPCMDDDDMRRGKPSCHVAFGQAMALLAGDALLTGAFEQLSGESNIAAIGAQGAVAQISVLSRAGGVSGMVGGQVLDVEPATGGRKLEELERTDSMKTGALIRAAAEMGCIAAGVGGSARQLASDYAGFIGLAFQIMDDVLDTYGQVSETGKRQGRDQKHNKTTYLTLLGRDEAVNTANELHRKAVSTLDKMQLKSRFLYEFTEALRVRTR